MSEVEASLLLYFTGRSRTSAAIIHKQSQNVRNRDMRTPKTMHALKEEAFRMKGSLLRGDFQLLHNVLRSRWESKKQMVSQIVNEKLERLDDCALNAGAYCAKISGAAADGFMMILTDPIHKDKLAAALMAPCDDGITYSCHFTPDGEKAWRVS